MDYGRELTEELKKVRNTEEVSAVPTCCHVCVSIRLTAANELAETAAALLHRTQLRRYYTRSRRSSAVKYTHTAKQQHSALSRRSRQTKTITQR